MIIEPKTVELGDKLRVVFVDCKDFKTSQITVSLLVPRERYMAENIIIPKYITHTTREYPDPAALNAKLEGLYGAIVSGAVLRRGESSRIEIGATCIANKFALENEDISLECLKLVMQLIFDPDVENNKFIKDKLELERRLSIENIESEINDKRRYALTRMTEIMCADEVYGITNAQIINELKSCNEETAFEAWKELLKTATVQVNLIGDFDREKALEVIKNRFDDIEREPVENSTVFVEAAEDVTEVTEEMDINQSKLVLGYRSGMTDKNDNMYAEQIMVDVFGGGPYSRLFMNVREKLSLCYYCSARLFRDKGIIAVQSGIEKENKQEALDEIKRQLEIMQNNEFDEDDFIASKTAICDSLRGVCDTPEGIDAFINTKIDEKILSIDEIIKNYESVTRKDVVEAAKRMSLDTVYMLSGRESAENE